MVAASDPKLYLNVVALEAQVCACYRCALEVYLVMPETLAWFHTRECSKDLV